MAPVTTGTQPPPEAMAWEIRLLSRRFLTPRAFELQLSRPPAFAFRPGQRIALEYQGNIREYSLASPPGADHLTLLVGLVKQGRLSPQLARLEIGTSLKMEGPLGHFIFQATSRPVVFIAGGTGVAPFHAMVAHGIRPDLFIQGAADLPEAYYQAWFRSRLDHHVLCLSRHLSPSTSGVDLFSGRVTDYLTSRLPADGYDFYVCGGPGLVRDSVDAIDDSFGQSRVRTELFH